MGDIWGQRCPIHDVAMRPDGTCILCERGKPRSLRPSAQPPQTTPSLKPSSRHLSQPPQSKSPMSAYESQPESAFEPEWPPRSEHDSGPPPVRSIGPSPLGQTLRPSMRAVPYERPPSRLGTAVYGLLFLACIGFLYLWFERPETLRALFE